MCRLHCSSWLCRGVLDRAHPHLVVAGLWRVALLEAPEDDVETGGDGAVPVSGEAIPERTFAVTVEVSGSQTYGSSAPALTYTDNAPAEVSVSGTLSCTTVNSGTAISSSLGADSYTIDGTSCSGLSVSDSSDYTLDYQGVTGGFVVGPALQAITWSPPVSGTVDGSATLSATGGASGNSVIFSVDSTSGEGVCSVSGTNGTTLDYSAVGTCVIDANQAGSIDYLVAQVKEAIPVGKAALLITASSGSMTYGGTVPTITPIYSGLVNGDTAPATPPVCSTKATSSSGVGSYDSSCSGAADANYSISYVDGTVTVDPAALKITASSPNVTYGAAGHEGHRGRRRRVA